MLDIKKLLAKIIGLESSTVAINKGTGVRNWCKKRNGLAEFYVEVTGATYSSGWNTIATLPSGYRPESYYDFIGKDNTNDTACSCKVTAGGEVQVYRTNSLSSALRMHSLHFIGGGYLTSKLYKIFSHLERWCGYVRYKETTNKGVDQSPVVILQCFRKRLPRLLQSAKSWQSCSCLGRILKWLDNHARRLSCVDNIITTIQTTTERQICMWRIGWNARDNRLRQYGWDCVSIYNSDHCLLEFYSYILCAVTLERGCIAC